MSRGSNFATAPGLSVVRKSAGNPVQDEVMHLHVWPLRIVASDTSGSTV